MGSMAFLKAYPGIPDRTTKSSSFVNAGPLRGLMKLQLPRCQRGPDWQFAI